LRWCAREPRELPPSSFSPFTHAPGAEGVGAPGAEGVSAESLVNLRVFPQSAIAPDFRIAARVLCMGFSVGVSNLLIGRLGLPTARESEFSMINHHRWFV